MNMPVFHIDSLFSSNIKQLFMHNLTRGCVLQALQSSTTGQSLGIPGLNGKRLLVKIVKATGVGCEKGKSLRRMANY